MEDKSFTIKVDNSKPHLKEALHNNPKLATEVISTFVAMMDEAFDDKGRGIPWAELPQQLHKDLTFAELVKGVLRGTLDVKEINPEAFDALKVEVHPLAMLSPRRNYLDDVDRVYHWRNHFSLPSNVPINAQTVAAILRRIMRYTRYIKIEDLAKALETNQLVTFRGLGERNLELLPMVPALRFQQKQFGDLRVGKFQDETGFLDCGPMPPDTGNECPACLHHTLKPTIRGFVGCLTCNAGYKV